RRERRRFRPPPSGAVAGSRRFVRSGRAAGGNPRSRRPPAAAAADRPGRRRAGARRRRAAGVQFVARRRRRRRMTRRIDWVVHRFAAVESTMDEAARLAAAGAPEGTVIRAEYQRAGRGRAGRAWASPPGASLLTTLLLRPDVSPDRLGALSLVAGV